MVLRNASKVLSFDRFTVTINFPAGQQCCKLCPLMHGMDRKQCARTGEYIANADGIGYYCPLQPDEKTDEELFGDKE